MTDNFFTSVIKKSPHFGSPTLCKDVAMLEPGTRAAVAAMMAAAKKAGHDLIVAETYRSSARQQMLYRQRLTQLQKVGVHGYGLACDLALYVGGKYDPNGTHYMFMEALAKSGGMISGIDWGTPNQRHSFRDYDHLQRVPVFRQAALFAGTWYPPEKGYDPYADQIAHGLEAVA